MRFSANLHHTDAPALTDLMARARELARDGPLINLAQAVVDFSPPDAFLEAVRRAGEEGATRPLLAVEDPEETARNLLSARERYYDKAHVGLDTDGVKPERLAQQIEKLMNTTGQGD